MQNVYIKDLRLLHQNEKTNSQQQKRSSSALKRVWTKISDQVANKEQDPYNYAFEIQMPDRCFLLYTELREESERWVRVLDLVVRMNKEGIPHNQTNPFDFEKYLND